MELNRYNGLNWLMTKVVTCRFVLTDNYIPANSTSLYLSLNELQIQLKLQYSLSRAYPTKPPGQAFFHSVRYICHPDGYVCHADRHTEVSRPLGQTKLPGQAFPTWSDTDGAWIVMLATQTDT